jgi:hypothetical protein
MQIPGTLRWYSAVPNDDRGPLDDCIFVANAALTYLANCATQASRTAAEASTLLWAASATSTLILIWLTTVQRDRLALSPAAGSPVR